MRYMWFAYLYSTLFPKRKRGYPTFFPKTNEERVQNIPNVGKIFEKGTHRTPN